MGKCKCNKMYINTSYEKIKLKLTFQSLNFQSLDLIFLYYTLPRQQT